jgi:hypothetical protein
LFHDGPFLANKNYSAIRRHTQRCKPWVDKKFPTVKLTNRRSGDGSHGMFSPTPAMQQLRVNHMQPCTLWGGIGIDVSSNIIHLLVRRGRTDLTVTIIDDRVARRPFTTSPIYFGRDGIIVLTLREQLRMPLNQCQYPP